MGLFLYSEAVSRTTGLSKLILVTISLQIITGIGTVHAMNYREDCIEHLGLRT